MYKKVGQKLSAVKLGGGTLGARSGLVSGIDTSSSRAATALPESSAPLNNLKYQNQLLLSNLDNIWKKLQQPQQHNYQQRYEQRRHHAVMPTGVMCSERAKITRSATYSKVTPADLEAFKEILTGSALGGGGVLCTDPDTIKPFNTSWLKDYTGEACPAVLQPRSTEQVSAILKYCNERKIAVVPQGGNTNFVGASTPVFDEVILSTKRMNTIIDINEMESTVTCQAGCILETLDNTLRERAGIMMPVDLGAKGSCFIGGNLSTNAGGVRYMRYGSLHGNIMGMKVVLADGEILDLKAFKKDNTGYNMKQLFVGTEGTLGIITEATLMCPPAPKSVQTMFLGLPCWDAVPATFIYAREKLGEILSAVEMIDGAALDLCLGITKERSPLGDARYPYYLLLETNGSSAAHDEEKLQTFLAEAMERPLTDFGVTTTGNADATTTPLVTDGTLASDSTKAKHIWTMRENCAVAPNALGYVRWYDIAMPSAKMAEMIDGTRAELAKHGLSEKAKIIGFGHLGDGNLHLNLVTIPEYNQAIVDISDNFIYGFSKEHGYSVSAEHGIGIQKKKFLGYTKQEATIGMMKKMKHLFDPNLILNPYKVFDA